jgi:hypothetical protein
VVHVALVALALVVGLALVTVTTYTPVLFLTQAVAHVLALTVVEQHKVEVVITAVTAAAEPVTGER